MYEGHPVSSDFGCKTLFSFLFVRPDTSHSSCMQKLRDAGIYVLVNPGGTTENDSDNRGWNYPLQRRYTAVANSLAKYSNVLGFWLMGKIEFLPFTKAAARDLKDHLQVSGYRQIPIGFGGLDSATLQLSEFLRCGAHNSSIDFFFYNVYSSCSLSSQTEENLERLTSFRPDLPIFIWGKVCDPVILADSKILLSANSENYTAVHSGSMLFSYFDQNGPRLNGPGTRIS
jgi:hypothetical protein